MHSGAISFLQRNGFDFGRQMTHGVPYLSLQEESQARTKMTMDAKREDMALKTEDQQLVQHVRDSIEKWQSQSKEHQEDYLNIPNHGIHDARSPGVPMELNSYQRRLVHQVVQNEFPAMKTQGMGHFIQVTNPSSEQQASQKEIEEQQRERDIARAIGFRWLIDGMMGRDISKIPEDYLLAALPSTTDAAEGDAPIKKHLKDLQLKLKDRRKILVGHNCLIDIMFLYKMAIGTLPETLSEFVDHLHDMFPAIIDTKFLSSCFSEKYGRLQLGDVEKDLRNESGTPKIFTSGEFDRYIHDAYLHEAGYDSYITAIVAIKMSSKLRKDGSQRKKDHDRQQEEVAKTAAASPPEFGIQDGYITATESIDSTSSEASNTALPEDSVVSSRNPITAMKAFFAPRSAASGTHHTKQDSVNSVVSNSSSTFSTSSTIDVASSPTSVVAIKTRTDRPSSTTEKPSSVTSASQQTVDRKDESQAAALRSAFASTSIYDKLDSNSAFMPGEDADSKDTEPISTAQKMEQLVKEGKMMPRWHEEGAFWDFYGNKLQVNGTVEGVLKILD